VGTRAVKAAFGGLTWKSFRNFGYANVFVREMCAKKEMNSKLQPWKQTLVAKHTENNFMSELELNKINGVREKFQF